MNIPLVYHPGETNNQNYPLARFLPRLPRGATRAWLKENIEPGSWVIDPFGVSPQLAVEAAKAGYKILVTANNPIARFLIEMAATPPSKEDLVSVLANLASAKRGDERMEPHILELYKTECDNCGLGVFADAFLWEKDSDYPYARIYTCTSCEHAGEFPANQADIQRAESFDKSGPHRARALERVASLDSPNREHVEEAMDAYLPRSIYALFTLINKLDGLGLSEQDSDLIIALLLTACDKGNTLWQVSGGRERPKQLTTPSRYFEHNIWFALEKAINIWVSNDTATTLAYWPELPPDSGGICLYEGRMSDFNDPLVDGIHVEAVICALPRPNQAYWTLSALWSGWLWGKEAIGPIVSVLKRRRYDWAWHTTALKNNLTHLGPILSKGSPFLGLITESETSFDISAVVAAELANFKLQSLAMRRKYSQTQMVWEYFDKPLSPKKTDPSNLIKTTANETLKLYGQPAHYRQLLNASLINLSQNNAIAIPDTDPADNFSNVRSALEFGLSFSGEFFRYEKSEHSLEVGWWWLPKEKDVSQPLADRVEKTIVNLLVNQSNLTFEEIDQIVCKEFPGLLTPEKDLINSILNSYAKQGDNLNWQLRQEDTPKRRREDLDEIKNILSGLGNKFALKITSYEGSLIWEGEKKFIFHISASAILGKILLRQDEPNTQNLIILPGSRAELVMKKLSDDPRLAEILENDWQILKFRWVRRLTETPGLTFDTFNSQLDLDPLSEDDPQLPLL